MGALELLSQHLPPDVVMGENSHFPCPETEHTPRLLRASPGLGTPSSPCMSTTASQKHGGGRAQPCLDHPSVLAEVQGNLLYLVT